MSKIYLIRSIANQYGTFGVIVRRRRRLKIHTAELEWKDNKCNISCIPAGTYTYLFLTISASGKYKRCYFLPDVPGRSGILIHQGNTAKDTEGCILVGKRLLINKQKKAYGVYPSRSALNKLPRLLGKRGEITIINNY